MLGLLVLAVLGGAPAAPGGAAGRNQALQELVWDRPGAAGERVMEAMADPDLGVREIAYANAALAKDQARLIALLRTAAKSEGREARWMVVRAAAGIPEVLTGLGGEARGWAADRDPLVRRALLANLAPGPGVAELMQPLLEGALTGPDAGDRMAAADGWVRLGLPVPDGIFRLLADGLGAGDRTTAGAAGYALNAFWSRSIRARVEGLIHDRRLALRVRAADLLRRHLVEFDPGIYAEVFARGDAEAQLYACGTLSRLSGDRAAAVLLEAADSRYSTVREAAVYALEPNGGEEAKRALFRLLRHPDARVRARAAVILDRMGLRRSHPALVPLSRLPRAAPGALRVPDCGGRPTVVRDGVVEVGAQKQLLVDDLSLASLGGAVRVFHPFRKDPRNPILEQEFPWEYTGTTVFFTSIDYDRAEGRLRLYYDSDMADPTPMAERGAPPSDRYRLPGRTQMVAFSTDGIRWIRPDLGRFPAAGGSRANNIVGSANNTIRLWRPEAGRFPFASYWNVSDGARLGVAVSFSPDGIGAWTELRRIAEKGGDVESMARDEIDHGYLGFTKWRRLWWLGESFGDRHTAEEARYRRALRLETAGGRSFAAEFGKDPDRFERGPINLLPGAEDDVAAPARVAAAFPGLDYFSVPEMHAEFYQVTSFPYEGIYFALPSQFEISGRRTSGRNDDGLIFSSLMFSRDRLGAGGWRRNGGRRLEPALEPGRWGEWDSVRCYGPNRLIVINDEIVLYYTGYSHGHESADYRFGTTAEGCPGEPYYRSAIGRATLRLDGFASLRAGPGGAVILTRPLRFAGRALEVNVDGEIGAEITDSSGRPLAGFERSRCRPFAGDSLHRRLQWTGSDLGSLAGKTVRVRFLLKSGDLYAYQFCR